MDILLVKHGLTNAFTEKSEHPSYAHLEICHQDILAAKHGITQRIHRRYSIRTDQYLARLDILLVKHGLTNAFTEKSEHPSYAHLEICHQDILAAKHGITQRIHRRYSIRTDQYLARLDILLVKHGLTNAFTEKSEHPSYAHLEICHQDILAAKHGITQRIHRRYSIRTDQYLARLDILLVKHGLTNAFTEKSEHPSYAHLEICHQDILAAKHGITQRIHRRFSIRTDQYLARLDILLVKHGLTNAFTEKSEHPSYAHLEICHQDILAAKHGITQRIHRRYSIRTDQYLARLDILLVKHGLTNAFTEKSEHPSYAHLEICHQDILAAKHGITQRIHRRYSIRTDQYLARLDILLVKHGLTNAFTEKSEHPSHAHLEICHHDILAAKHGLTQRIHRRYSIRTDQYLARLDILLVKHGLTNAFTEKSEHPSHAHLEICHQDILAAKHGLTNAFTVDIPKIAQKYACLKYEELASPPKENGGRFLLVSCSFARTRKATVNARVHMFPVISTYMYDSPSLFPIPALHARAGAVDTNSMLSLLPREVNKKLVEVLWVQEYKSSPSGGLQKTTG